MGRHAQEEAAAAAEDADVAPAALPAKLLNNAAVLHMRAGESAAALSLVREALTVRPPHCAICASLTVGCILSWSIGHAKI